MTTNTALVTLGVACAAASGIGIEMMRRWSARRLLDLPNARSSHTLPTPRGGGLPLVAAAFGAWILLLASVNGLRTPPYLTLGVAVLAVASVSWVDDLRTLRFKTRLLTHVAAALLVLAVAPPPSAVTIGDFPPLPLGLLAWPLAIIWIAGLANAYNFMDGIDGIAGGQGMVAAAAWGYLGIRGGDPILGALGVFVAIACAVFLLFNWSPARIFMGDVGAATLGFLFAALPFVWRGVTPPGARELWVPAAACVWPFVFDAGFTLVRRWRRGEKVTEAHRSHLYQRLVIAGWSHARASLIYILWAGISTGTAVLMARDVPGSGIVALLWASLSGLAVWSLTVRVERSAGVSA